MPTTSHREKRRVQRRGTSGRGDIDTSFSHLLSTTFSHLLSTTLSARSSQPAATSSHLLTIYPPQRATNSMGKVLHYNKVVVAIKWTVQLVKKGFSCCIVSCFTIHIQMMKVSIMGVDFSAVSSPQ